MSKIKELLGKKKVKEGLRVPSNRSEKSNEDVDKFTRFNTMLNKGKKDRIQRMGSLKRKY